MKSAIVFENDEMGYLDWIDRHPNGFVLNMPKNKDPQYRVLHTANCPTIKNYTEMAKEGGFTEREYIKVCAGDVASLEVWSRLNSRPDGGSMPKIV